MEFIASLDPSSSSHGIAPNHRAFANHENRICSLLAQADAIAYGGTNNGSNNHRGRFESMSSPGSPPIIQTVDSMLSHGSINGNGGDSTTAPVGNQPSTLLLCGACDAFTCGQLVALAEHRAIVKAWLWDADPFVTVKSSIKEERREYLSGKLHQMYHLLSIGETLEEAKESLFPEHHGTNDDTDSNGIGVGMRSATIAVLKEYATRMQRHRPDSVPTTPMR
mmetsp:Transcript_11928/g.20715  ORF Transcript_11928/g.20715 Transcript_11928/m.20715 type:complete len:222 (+) Transcript_11928:1-666(+)